MWFQKLYPYLPQGRDFSLDPPPFHLSGNSSQASYIYINFWAFENPPTPRNFQSLPWGEYGYFPELHIHSVVHELGRASDNSRGRGPAKFRYFCEILRNFPKNTKYREIRQKNFQMHVGKIHLILILAIRPVLFTSNVQIYLETSSLQRVNNVSKLPGVLDERSEKLEQKTGH